MAWLRERKRVRYGEEVDLNGDKAGVCVCVFSGGLFPHRSH